MSCELSTSHLPGIWVIETLARSNEVDTSLLLDLLKKFPQTSNNLGRNARELLSFRILEIFLFRGAQSNSLSSSSSPKIAFDPSKSCEDVLLQILHETPTFNLKAIGPEMWKWDVQAFIAQKRSSLDNYSLLQLKDAILAGSHSFLASFKEQSGLPFGNQPEHGNHIGRGNDQGASVSVDNGYLLHTDLHNEIKRKRRVITKNVARKSCKDSIISKNGCENNRSCSKKNDVIQCEDSGGNLISDVNKQHSDMLRIVKYSDNELNGCLASDNNECIYLKDPGGSDEVLPREKQALHSKRELPNDKCAGEQGLENEITEAGSEGEGLCDQKSAEGMEKIYSHIEANAENGDEKENFHIFSDAQCMDIRYSSATNFGKLNVLADICAGLVESREVLGHSLKNKTCLGGMRQNGLPRDANSECTSSKRVIGHNNLKAPNEKTYDAENAGDMKGFHELKSTGGYKDTFEEEPCKNVPDPGDSEDIDVLSDSDKYCDEITDIAAKKKAFLSSQCTLNQGVDPSTQLNVCMKCNKGGEQLVCSTNCCPLVIHESCSPHLSFNMMGEFYCPFCAYSQAITSYMDAKKKVSLKRKDLANFVCLQARQDPTKQPEHDDGIHKSDELNNEDIADHANNHHPKKTQKSGMEGNHSLGGYIVDSYNEAPYPLRIYREGWKNKGKMQDINRSESNPKIRSKKRVLCFSETYSSIESKCLVHTESDYALEISENSGVPKHSSRVQKHKRCMHPEIPRLRRTRVPWTSAEEEALKEGIRRFCNPDEQIPWRQILDFGAGVFQESRITVDLKDKWKNLCKAYPEYENLLRK